MDIRNGQFPPYQGKPCVSLDAQPRHLLDEAGWKMGSRCSIGGYQTAPVGTVVYLRARTYTSSGPNGAWRYVLARVVSSQERPPHPQQPAGGKWYRTSFVLLENG